MSPHAIKQKPGALALGFCIAKLKEETEAKGQIWPAGHILTRNGNIIVWDMQYVSEPFKSEYEWIPVECMNPRFKLKEIKKENYDKL